MDGSLCAEDCVALWDRAGALAARLHAADPARDGHVLILCDQVHEFTTAMWSCLRAGCVAVPLTSMVAEVARGETLDDLQALLDRFEHPLLVAPAALQARCRTLGHSRLDLLSVDQPPPAAGAGGVFAPRGGDEPALLIPTSGTTGESKLVTISSSAMLARMLRLDAEATTQAGKTCVNWFALDGTSSLPIWTLEYQDAVHVSPKRVMLDPLALLDVVNERRASYVSLTSYLAARIVELEAEQQRDWDLSCLQRVGFGAELLEAATLEAFAVLLGRYGVALKALSAGYGSSELGLIANGPLRHQERLAEQGAGACVLEQVRPRVSLRIADDADRVRSMGEVGHIQVEAPQTLFSGYFGQPELTRDAKTADGWYRVGDLGLLTDEGLIVTGRSGDVATINGRKIGLPAVEHIIRTATGEHQVVACKVRQANADAVLVFIEPRERVPEGLGRLQGAARSAVQQSLAIDVTVIPIWPGQVPRTANGKVRRPLLARQYLAGALKLLATAGGRVDGPSATPSTGNAFARVGAIWQQALGAESPPAPDDDFMALGGTSFAAAQLLAELEAQLGFRLPVARWIVRPTYARLLNLVQSPRGEQDDQAGSDLPWPMPRELFERQLAHVAAWSGQRRSPLSLVSVHNAEGRHTPLVWVFQSDVEFRQLAQALGPDQPLYGLRSGSGIMKYEEQQVQSLALAYAAELDELLPHRTVNIGGNCQGALIAQALAEHRARRGELVRLLVLMEWGFPLRPYRGPVLLLFGEESTAANPRFRYRLPELGWRRAYPDYRADYIPGAHGEFFEGEGLRSLASSLQRYMRQAAQAEHAFLPVQALRASLELVSVPAFVVAGAHCKVKVRVSNTSDAAWPPFRRSGLTLGGRWFDDQGNTLVHRDGLARVPALFPGQSKLLPLRLLVPRHAAPMRLGVDLFEEGHRRLSGTPTGLAQASFPAPLPNRWRAIRRRMRRLLGR